MKTVHFFPRLSFSLVGFLCLTLFCGCLFTPRDPEPPSSAAPIDYLPRTSPRNVWANLGTSLENNDSFGWEENLHPEFTYLPDAESENQFPGAFTGWDLAKEMIFINNFYASDVTNIASMRDSDFNVPEPVGNEVHWEGVIYYVRVGSDGSETRYRASAIIIFRFEGNFWYVYSWEDQVGESDPDSGTILPTMGVLRATFGS